MNKPKTVQISKKNGNITTSQFRNLNNALNQLGDGNYIIRIEPNDIIGNPRGKYFAIVGLVAAELGNDNDFFHKEFKRRFNEGKSTSAFKSDTEWSDYINKVLVFCRTELEINVPDSKSFTYEKWIQIKDNTKQLIKF